MIFIAYILILAASLVMVYFGHAQGTSQFYMSVFSAAVIWYCVYLDFKKRQEKKAEKENSSTAKGQQKAVKTSKDNKSNTTTNISKIAHKSTKDKHLNQ